MLFFFYSLALTGSSMEFLKHVCETAEDAIDYTDIVQVSANPQPLLPSYILISFLSAEFSIKKYKNNKFDIYHDFYKKGMKIYEGMINQNTIEKILETIFFCLKIFEKDILDPHFLIDNSRNVSTEIEIVYLDFREFNEFIPEEKIPIIEFYILQKILKYIKSGIAVKIINKVTVDLCNTNIYNNIEDINISSSHNYFYLPITRKNFGVRIYYEKILTRLIETNELDEEDKEVFKYFKNPEEFKFILSYFKKHSASKFLILRKIFENHVSYKNIDENKQIFQYETELEYETVYKLLVTIIKYLLEDKIVFSSNTSHEFEGFKVTQPYKMLYQFNCVIMSILRKKEDLYEKLVMRYCNGEVKFKSKNLEVLLVMDVYRIIILKLFNKINIRESNNAFEGMINLVESHLNFINENIENEIIYNYRCVDLDLVLRILDKYFFFNLISLNA